MWPRSAVASRSTKPILASEKKLRNVITKRNWKRIKKKYGNTRRAWSGRSRRVGLPGRPHRRRRRLPVTVSHSGSLKRTPISTYRQQRRGGDWAQRNEYARRGFCRVSLRRIYARLHSSVFTNTGRVYWLKVYEIPELGAAGKGKAIANSFVSFSRRKRTGITHRARPRRRRQIRFLRHPQRTVKKTPLKDFSNVGRCRGFPAGGATVVVPAPVSNPCRLTGNRSCLHGPADGLWTGTAISSLAIL